MSRRVVVGRRVEVPGPTVRRFLGFVVGRLPSEGSSTSVQRTAPRKLVSLDAADTVEDLRLPPGNHLEKLSGDWCGQHSIGINQRWRICFRWADGDAYDVEIVNHHQAPTMADHEVERDRLGDALDEQVLVYGSAGA